MSSTIAASRPETSTVDPGPRPLVTAVLEYARSQPDLVAVRDSDGNLTYAELVARAAGLAAALHADAAPDDAPVAVCGARDRNLVVGALAARMAGRPYLLLDVTQPLERSRFILEDSGARVTLATSSEGVARLASLGGPATVLDIADVPALEGDPHTQVVPGEIAYLCYTSGSTGNPKGAWVSTTGIDLLAEWYVQTHQVSSQDRLSQVSSPSFDAWGLEVWPALRGGAELVVATAETVRSPTALARWLARTGIDICFLATPLAVEVLQEWPREEEARLRAMLVGGDRLVAPPAEAPPFRLFNNYGPTECSVVATAVEVTGFGGAESPPIGPPLPYVEAEVRRRDGGRCEVGETGELFLGGPALSPGYVHAVETEAAFAREPSPDGGERTLYRTGDLVYADGAGILHYVGRSDDQVKINGVRIEPAEVESALTSHPSVVDAAVVVQATPSGDPRLVGYVVVADPAAVEPAAIRATAATRLPDAMVPSVVVVDRLPQTGNGKVDRHALRILDTHASSRPVPNRRANDGIALVVEEAWVELLGLDGVGADDDFFDLGGDSLRALRLVRRLDKAGIRMTPEDLYRASSFGALVETLIGSGQEARSEA